jgi:hypothetical protein
MQKGRLFFKKICFEGVWSAWEVDKTRADTATSGA